ncbi:hypothetical protein BDV19DRAFT_364979, partial [Aspergillus venezuelensis]
MQNCRWGGARHHSRDPFLILGPARLRIPGADVGGDRPLFLVIVPFIGLGASLLGVN